MKNRLELDLLMDLVRLLKKYGAETFGSLATLISSTEISLQLATILTQVATISRTVSKRNVQVKPIGKYPIPKSLAAIKNAEPDKYQLLTDFMIRLTDKVVLQSLGEMKQFAKDAGLPEVRATSRQKAISPLIGSLVKLSNEQLISIIKSPKSQKAGDRSLEGWSDIILRNRLGSDQKP